MRKNNTEIHLWKNLGVDKWKGRLKAAKALDVGKLKERAASAATSAKGNLSASLGKALQRGAGAKDVSKDGGGAASAKDEAPMTREQALQTLGLDAGASERDIDAALKALKGRTGGLNGSDHAIAAKLNAAREVLRGKEGT